MKFQEARDVFIKALDEYIRKCQELAGMMSQQKSTGFNNNDGSQQRAGQQNSTTNQSDEELEKMMNKFTTLLQGFAFQLASTGSPQ